MTLLGGPPGCFNSDSTHCGFDIPQIVRDEKKHDFHPMVESVKKITQQLQAILIFHDTPDRG